MQMPLRCAFLTTFLTCATLPHYTTRENTGGPYRTTSHQSMPDIYQPRCTPFDARSSMCTAGPAQWTDAHLEGFAFLDQRPELHLKRDATSVTINSDTFLADVIWAVRQFFIDHDGDTDVEAAADKLLVVGVGMEQVRGFDLMHCTSREPMPRCTEL